MKELFGLQLLRFWFVIALLLGGTAGTRAQQQPQKKTNASADVPPPPGRLESELAKANYDRVAASAPQIKEVLLRDPGLLVELKTWIAKEASDNGQATRSFDQRASQAARTHRSARRGLAIAQERKGCCSGKRDREDEEVLRRVRRPRLR